MGEAIGKSMDIAAQKYDVRVVSGSTMPVNRWAYLEELKELMRMGIVDDIAVLAETDIKNKEQIVKRKSLYSQLQSQVSGLEEELKKEKGTNETLERQVVQANIRNKVMQSDVEVNKQKEATKSRIYKEELDSIAQQKHLRNTKAETEKKISTEENKPLELMGL